MRSEVRHVESSVIRVTFDREPVPVRWSNLRHSRLEGISSRYWTPSEKRSRGLVSSGSSTLLPSAVLRPAETQGDITPNTSGYTGVSDSLTLAGDRSRIDLVSQTACRLLAPIQSEAKRPRTDYPGSLLFGHEPEHAHRPMEADDFSAAYTEKFVDRIQQ